MSNCDADTTVCIHEADGEETLVPKYATSEIGIPIVLVDSVYQKHCKHCGEVLHRIQFPDRLTAAAAVSRAQLPMKLKGDEIRFLRKAIAKSAVELAEFLEVAPETVSRWENNKLPMSPALEKLLRLHVGMELKAKAPAILFKPNQVLNMAIKGVRDPSEEIVMVFQLVVFLAGAEDEPGEEYREKRAA